VDVDGLYLTDDRNTAVFPDEQGCFTDCVSGAHYEVQGFVPASANHAADIQQPASATPFQFIQQPVPGPVAATSTMTPAFRRPSTGSKTFQR